MRSENQSEWITSKNLVNKGWHIDESGSKNVFFQYPPYPEQKKKLKGKRPDYILYQTGTQNPIAIIEVKKSGANLAPALNQATNYAKLLEVPLVFATNGSYCETRFVPNNKELILNGEEVRELLREREALKFLESNSNEAWTIPEEVKLSRDELIKKFKELNEVLRSDGIQAGIDRFGEFANILFLKLLSENSETSWWDSIKSQSDDHIIGYINSYIIKQIQSKYGGDVFTPISIRNPRILRHIINTIDPLVLSNVDTDIKGDAFEYFLAKATSTPRNDLGEYFTPRNIVKTIIHLVNPKLGETVYDPFCGTGGFLTEVFSYIKENNILETEDDRNKLRNETLFGREITKNARIAKMNMILHGDGHSGVQQINSLENPDFTTQRGGGHEKELFSIVVTNIPFSQKINIDGIGNSISPLYYNGLAKNSGDAVCVLHCLQSLKHGGRMALIVPEGFLFKKELMPVRRHLLSKAKLKCVISLPKGVFLPYTQVKTNILYFTDAHKPNDQKYFWFFEVKNIGVTLDNHKRKTQGYNDLKKLESSDVRKTDNDLDLLKNDMLRTGFKINSIKDCKKNNYSFLSSHVEVIESTKSNIVKLANVVLDIKDGGTPPRKKQDNHKYFGGDINWCKVKDVKPEIYNTEEKLTQEGLSKSSSKIWPVDSIIITLGATIGKVGIVKKETATKQGLSGIIVDKNKVLPKYLYYILSSKKEVIKGMGKGTTLKEVRPKNLINNLTLPLPSLEEQGVIVEELGKYQKIIDGCRQVFENYKPTIDIDPSWETTSFDKAPIEIIDGDRGKNYPSGTDFSDEGHCLFLNTKNVRPDGFDFSETMFITKEKDEKLRKGKLKKYDVVLTTRGTVGNTAFFGNDVPYEHLRVNSGMLIFRCMSTEVDSEYLFFFFQSKNCSDQFKQLISGSAQPQLPISSLKNALIPIPSIDVQKAIVETIKTEKAIIDDNMRLKQIYTQKIQDRINKIWQS